MLGGVGRCWEVVEGDGKVLDPGRCWKVVDSVRRRWKVDAGLGWRSSGGQTTDAFMYREIIRRLREIAPTPRAPRRSARRPSHMSRRTGGSRLGERERVEGGGEKRERQRAEQESSWRPSHA